MVKRSPEDYLSRMERYRLTPTFWSSLSYLRCLGDLEVYQVGSTIWMEEDGLCLLPPISGSSYLTDFTGRIWAVPPYLSDQLEDDQKEFLDWEYLYRGYHFLNLSGGSWQVFRKNVRKWPRYNPEWSYISIPSHEFATCFGVLESWLDSRPSDQEIQDSNTILRYMREGAGEGEALFSRDRMVGFNLFDRSWLFTNFRYSFTDPGEPFLAEFLRYQFYLNHHELVNDGGTLGNTNLERFKDKLNPICKSRIYSKKEE